MPIYEVIEYLNGRKPTLPKLLPETGVVTETLDPLDDGSTRTIRIQSKWKIQVTKTPPPPGTPSTQDIIREDINKENLVTQWTKSGTRTRYIYQAPPTSV